MMLITKRITGKRILQAENSRDITGVYFIHIIPAVSAHAHQTADAFFLTLHGIIEHHTLFDRSGIDPEIS